MALFRNQPGFCANCGKPGEYEVRHECMSVCSRECSENMRWKYTLYIMGKDYYPRPVKP